MVQTGSPVSVQGQRNDCQNFSETGKTICGRFLEYWLDHGELAQQGLPLSETFLEQSATDGKTYIVQYFERAIFEYHPNNAPPNDVQLSLLGVFRLRAKYGSRPSFETPSKNPNAITFPQTGKKLGGAFLVYWLEHGSVAQQELTAAMSGYFERGAGVGGHDHGYFNRDDISGGAGAGVRAAGGRGSIANENLEVDPENPNSVRAIPKTEEGRIDETAGTNSPDRVEGTYPAIVEGSDSERTGTSWGLPGVENASTGGMSRGAMPEGDRPG